MIISAVPLRYCIMASGGGKWLAIFNISYRIGDDDIEFCYSIDGNFDRYSCGVVIKSGKFNIDAACHYCLINQ